MALILDKDDYRTVMSVTGSTINRLTNPVLANEAIVEFSTPFETLNTQEAQKAKKSAYEIQDASTDIGVERIVERIKEQYV